MSYYCTLGNDHREEICEDSYDDCGFSIGGASLCKDGTLVYEKDAVKVIGTSCVYYQECFVCSKVRCKSFRLNYRMTVKGPGGGYLEGDNPNYCPECGRYIQKKEARP